MKNFGILAAILPFAALLVIAFLFTVGWERPPIGYEQTGYRGTGMQEPNNPREQAMLAALNAIPEEIYPLDSPADLAQADKAGDVYENVQVLGDLPEPQFIRLMTAITEWVSPEQGCEYCHNLSSEQGFADDGLYTKVVARSMLQMVRHINSNWPEHVAPSGVTCYTCHRGQNVPPRTWYDQNPPSGDQFIGKPRPWHVEAKTIRQFFPDVPLSKYLKEEHANARIQSSDPLVSRTGRPEVAREQDAEDMYLFMMQVSNSLGVNCTYCHNSRAFRDWSQSTPYRWIAYWGIRMTRDINTNYIQPLASVFPANRKGPLGDPAKAECGTCHIGNNKPLGGYKLLEHYLVGLTEDGKAPDPGPKEAILIGEAKPMAVTGPDQDAAQPAPSAPPVSEEAIGQSVAPGGSGDGVEFGFGRQQLAVAARLESPRRKTMNISDASRDSGLPAKTIRYYEDIGLVKPGRLENGYRDYSDDDLHKLRFLQRSRGLGFSVEDCRVLLSLYEDRNRASADVKQIAKTHLIEIERKIAELQSLQKTLSHLVDECQGDHRPHCPIINDLAG